MSRFLLGRLLFGATKEDKSEPFSGTLDTSMRLMLENAELKEKVESIAAERTKLIQQCRKLRDWLSDDSHAYRVTARQVINEILVDLEGASGKQ